MKTTQSLFQGYEIKRKGNERSDLLQQICDATGIGFPLLLRETFHLKQEWGNRILRMILDDTLAYSTERGWRRWKCADLVRKSK